jgi:hypothetical protein
MSGMDTLGKVWDGYEWVVPPPPMPEMLPQHGRLAEPSARRWGLAANRFLERQEAQRKLVSIQREVYQLRAQRARAEAVERKTEVGRAVRQETDVINGRAAHAAFVDKLVQRKITAASDEVLANYAERLNQSLADQHESKGGGSSIADPSSVSREDMRQRWIRLFRTMEVPPGSARVPFKAFRAGVRELLRRLSARERGAIATPTHAARAAAADLFSDTHYRPSALAAKAAPPPPAASAPTCEPHLIPDEPLPAHLLNVPRDDIMHHAAARVQVPDDGQTPDYA